MARSPRDDAYLMALTAVTAGIGVLAVVLLVMIFILGQPA